MNRSSITHAQYGLMVLSIPLTAALLHYTPLVYEVGTRGWLATVVVGILLVLLLSWFLAALMNRYPGRTIVGVARDFYGPVLGGLVVLPILLCELFSTLFALRGLNEMVVRTLLPETPETLVLVTALAGAAYLASNGAEGLGRYAEVVTYLIGIPTLIPLLFLAFKNVDPAYLEPIFWWPQGMLATSAFWRSLTLFMSAPTILIFAPYLQPQRRAMRPLFWAGMASLLIVTAVTSLPLGTLGPETAAGLTLPVEFSLGTMSTTILFIQQLSYIVVALWTLYIVLGAAVTLWVAARGAAEVVGRGSTIAYVWAMAAGVYLLGVQVLHFPTYQQMFNLWSEACLAAYAFTLLVFWPMAWWGSRRRAPGGTTHEGA